VLPAMTALALTARIGLVFVLATLIGALSGVGGYVVSFRGDLPVGATQTATAAALLAAALAFRFDRARYDSDRTAEAFSTRVRSEVDLDAVADDLTGSVRRALRPQAMSLWLKGPGR